MMRIHTTLAVASVLVMLHASGSVSKQESRSPGSQDANAGIRKLLDDLMAANNAGNVSRAVDLYGENAMMLPPGAPNVPSRDAIRKHYEAAFATYELAISATADEVRVGTDWGVVRGRVTGTIARKPDGTPGTLSDKFMAIVERGADGKWRFSRMMWSRAE